jgi:hypothetical protein
LAVSRVRSGLSRPVNSEVRTIGRGVVEAESDAWANRVLATGLRVLARSSEDAGGTSTAAVACFVSYAEVTGLVFLQKPQIPLFFSTA